MPGLIDCNTNMQDLAKEKWEGFDYGTKAAASGGITTLVDLPIMKKPTLTSIKNLHTHIDSAEKQVYIDVAFIAYLNNDNIHKI